MIFVQSAKDWFDKKPSSLNMPDKFLKSIGNILQTIERGYIHLIESNNLRDLHRDIHWIIVDAIKNKWNVILIDMNNSFNPHLISEIAFENKIQNYEVLQRINLARPFQIEQAINTIRRLKNEIKSNNKNELIIITDIYARFFKTEHNTMRKKELIKQFEDVQRCIGVLRELAVDGYTLLVTQNTIIHDTNGKSISPASLKYAAKIHLKIINSLKCKKIKLLNHPNLPYQEKILIIDTKKSNNAKTHDSMQSDLNDFY